jgi:hypothetical protein
MKYHVCSLLLLLSAVSGCRNDYRPEGLPVLYPVVLHLTQEKEPLVEATISLFPLDSENHWSSGGFTNREGNARIVTHGGFDGVPTGRYKVVVVKSIVEGVPKSVDEMGTPRAYSLIETPYTTRKSTPLEIEVQKNNKNQFQLNVGKAVKVKSS